MDGLSRVSGAPVPITLAGRKLLLRGLGLEDYGVIEQKLLDERGEDPVEAIGPQLERLAAYPALQNYVLDRFYAEVRRKPDAPTRVSEQEVMAYLQTFEGRCFSMYLALRHDQPDVTEEEARRLVEEEMKQNGAKALERLRKQLDQASGTDTAGNSTGRPSEEPNGRPNETNPSPGDGITETLRHSITGPLPL